MRIQSTGTVARIIKGFSLAVGLIGFSTPVLSNDSVSIDSVDFATILKMPKAFVETHVGITWSDGKPVIGAKVFDHRNHQLLGLTNQFGKLLVTVPNGTLLRLVEPNYGQQQALIIVQGKRKNDKELLSTTSTSPYFAVVTGGWTIN